MNFWKWLKSQFPLCFLHQFNIWLLLSRFLDKTKNDWDQRSTFQKVAGKYDMVFMDYSTDTQANPKPTYHHISTPPPPPKQTNRKLVLRAGLTVCLCRRRMKPRVRLQPIGNPPSWTWRSSPSWSSSVTSKPWRSVCWRWSLTRAKLLWVSLIKNQSQPWPNRIRKHSLILCNK